MSHGNQELLNRLLLNVSDFFFEIVLGIAFFFQNCDIQPLDCERRLGTVSPADNSGTSGGSLGVGACSPNSRESYEVNHVYLEAFRRKLNARNDVRERRSNHFESCDHNGQYTTP